MRRSTKPIEWDLEALRRAVVSETEIAHQSEHGVARFPVLIKAVPPEWIAHVDAPVSVVADPVDLEVGAVADAVEAVDEEAEAAAVAKLPQWRITWTA